MRRLAVLAASVVVASAAVAVTPASPAQVITAMTDTARAAVGKGDWTAVVKALDDATRYARRQAPLSITAAQLMPGAHGGLGIYDKAVNDVVTDKRLRIYLEVENLSATPLSPGRLERANAPDRTSENEGSGQDAKRAGPERFRHELDIVGQFYVVEGKTLEPLGQKNLGRETVDTWRPLDVHAIGLDFTLGDAPPGPYVVDVVVTDVVTRKTATRRVPFTMR